MNAIESLALFTVVGLHLGACLVGMGVMLVVVRGRRVGCDDCCVELGGIGKNGLSLGARWCLGPDTAAGAVEGSGRSGSNETQSMG